ncbi:cerebellin-1-like [Mytilus trossulus]|uniref:cerebellin-1-like n=1 Tax=Mytilus trossulus TaxID=6551 RepID=UPI003005BF27
MHTDTKNRLSALTDDHSATNRILHTTRTDLGKASDELVKVKRALAHEKEQNRQSRIIPPTAVTTSKPGSQSVAFFAVMTDHQQHLGIHQTVGFQRAVTNVGNGWDGQANVFKAPRAGLYYFSATIMSHYAEDIETELVMKGVPIVYSYDGDKATHGVGTLSAVLNLSIGDDVWIRIYNNPVANDGNVRVYGGAWSWFSGFLISE